MRTAARATRGSMRSLGNKENDEDDPFCYDSDMFCELTADKQDRFLHERLQCAVKQNEFLKELLRTQRR